MSILCTCYMVCRVQPNAGPTIPFTKHDRHWGWFMSLGLPHYHKPSRYIIVHYDHPLSLSIITTKSYKIYKLWLSIITIHCNSPTISDVRISSTISRLWSSHQVPWLPRSSMKPWLPWRYKGAVFSPGGCGLFIGGLCSSKCATFFTWNYKNYFFLHEIQKKNYWENRIQHASIQCTEKGIWRWWNCTAHGSACEALLPGGCPSIHPWLRMVITIPPIWWLGDGAFMTWLKTHIIRIPIWDWWRSPQG